MKIQITEQKLIIKEPNQWKVNAGNFQTLPKCIIIEIASYLSAAEQSKFNRTCKYAYYCNNNFANKLIERKVENYRPNIIPSSNPDKDLILKITFKQAFIIDRASKIFKTFNTLDTTFLITTAYRYIAMASGQNGRTLKEDESYSTSNKTQIKGQTYYTTVNIIGDPTINKMVNLAKTGQESTKKAVKDFFKMLLMCSEKIDMEKKSLDSAYISGLRDFKQEEDFEKIINPKTSGCIIN